MHGWETRLSTCAASSTVKENPPTPCKGMALVAPVQADNEAIRKELTDLRHATTPTQPAPATSTSGSGNSGSSGNLVNCDDIYSRGGKVCSRIPQNSLVSLGGDGAENESAHMAWLRTVAGIRKGAVPQEMWTEMCLVLAEGRFWRSGV